jgi:hypothetical protein
VASINILSTVSIIKSFFPEVVKETENEAVKQHHTLSTTKSVKGNTVVKLQ